MFEESSKAFRKVFKLGYRNTGLNHKERCVAKNRLNPIVIPTRSEESVEL